ncbi:hypothetical protein AAHE18_15G186900 [Arachis hypogaea]
MGSQTKSDQKKISVHISNEKCVDSIGCRFPLEEIQNRSDLNTQVEESSSLSNNKRKVDEYGNSHWTSMANTTVSSFVTAEINHHYGLKDSSPTDMGPIAQTMLVGESPNTIHSTNKISHRVSTTNVEAIYIDRNYRINTREECQVLGNNRLAQDLGRHFRMEQTLKLVKKRKC